MKFRLKIYSAIFIVLLSIGISGFMLFEWLRYLRYIKTNYGYLFSLAIRTNPFDPEATIAVKN
jgi:hypothetical protein